MLKALVVGLALSVSNLANAGLIEYTYDGSYDVVVDSEFGSQFDINIADNYIITDLNVQIQLENEFLGDLDQLFWSDLDIWLTNGTTTVSLAVGHWIDQDDEFGKFSVTFDDEAQGFLPAVGDAIGAWKPNNEDGSTLSDFDGQTTNGLWSLLFDDYFLSDEGDKLVDFKLSVTTVEVPEPSTFVIFALGIMGLASRRFKKQS